MSLRELTEAKAKLIGEYRDAPGIEGFGIGEDCVRVYVKDEASAQQLPKMLGTVRVETIITGTISAPDAR